MWCLWNAPSDRDYYGDNGLEEPEEDRCSGCGAGPGQACEEWCGREQNLKNLSVATLSAQPQPQIVQPKEKEGD